MKLYEIRAHIARQSALLQTGSTSAVNARSLSGAGSTRECGFREGRAMVSGDTCLNVKNWTFLPARPLAATSVVFGDSTPTSAIERRGSLYRC